MKRKNPATASRVDLSAHQCAIQGQTRMRRICLSPDLSGGSPLRAFRHAQIGRREVRQKGNKTVDRQQRLRRPYAPGVCSQWAMRTRCTIRVGRQLFGRGTLVIIGNCRCRIHTGGINAEGINTRCISGMLMRVVTEMLHCLACFMHAIRTRHAPADLEGESKHQHVDEFFRHGRIIDCKLGTGAKSPLHQGIP